MKSQKKNKTKKTTIKRSVKILWTLVLGGIIAAVMIFAAAYFGLFGKLPSLQELENPQADLASEIYGNDGTLMGKIYTENRTSADFKDISKHVIDALVSTEDIRFYEHSGVDAIAIARAIKGVGSEGGGSTITQQLAKNILGQGGGWAGKRILDKLKEWIVAIKLERNFTKQEILALYLNRVSWLNVYGIRNASMVYFQKQPSDLTTDEAALLIGMLSGPGKYDPVRHPEAALARRNLVLDREVTNNVLSASEAEKLKKKPLGIKYKKLDENVGIAPYFRSVLTKKLVDWCKTHTDPTTGRHYDLYRDGLKIYTTIDPKMQLFAEEAVVKHMAAMQTTFNRQLSKNVWKGHEDILEDAMKQSDRWHMMKEDGISDADIKKSFYVPVKMKVFAWNSKRETDTVMTPIDSIKYFKQMMQTAFCVMDPVTGEVKAWVGGIDFKWFKFDHVTAARQVGSTFKPLLYTLALTDAGLTPESQLGGKAITLAKKTFDGPGGTMAYCLAKSLNVAAWDLMSRIGPRRTADFAHQCGITNDIPLVPSIALGTADIKLIDMLRAYTMFPNRGLNTQPIFISRIEDKHGNVLESFTAEQKPEISEVDAYTMYKMMQGVMDYGTGGAMRWKYNITSDMGGKTGTTNDNTDGWFIGYTPQLLAGAWVGCDDPFLHLRNGWTHGGNDMAMPEWAFFMQKVYADKKLGIDPKATFQKPAELNNNPIYADQNFSQLVKEGQGNDYVPDNGNGNADDYQNAPTNIPVESEFNANQEKDDYSAPSNNKAANIKKDTTSLLHAKKEEEKVKNENKPAKPASDY